MVDQLLLDFTHDEIEYAVWADSEDYSYRVLSKQEDLFGNTYFQSVVAVGVERAAIQEDLVKALVGRILDLHAEIGRLPTKETS